MDASRDTCRVVQLISNKVQKKTIHVRYKNVLYSSSSGKFHLSANSSDRRINKATIISNHGYGSNENVCGQQKLEGTSVHSRGG